MIGDIPDHPIVQNLECTGFSDGKEPRIPHCPSCEAETDTFYKTIAGEIAGCDNCLRSVDAWNETDEY